MTRVNAPVMTRWAIVIDQATEPARDEAGTRQALKNWFADGRRAYFERCASLRETGLRLLLRSEQLSAHRPLTIPTTIRIAVGVIELRDRTLDMQMRVRDLADGAVVASGRCTLGLVEAATQAPVPLPDALRQELIAIEQAAGSYC